MQKSKCFFFVECHFVGWYKEPGSLFMVIEVICNTPVAQCIQQQAPAQDSTSVMRHLITANYPLRVLRGVNSCPKHSLSFFFSLSLTHTIFTYHRVSDILECWDTSLEPTCWPVSLCFSVCLSICLSFQYNTNIPLISRHPGTQALDLLLGRMLVVR